MRTRACVGLRWSRNGRWIAVSLGRRSGERACSELGRPRDGFMISHGCLEGGGHVCAEEMRADIEHGSLHSRGLYETIRGEITDQRRIGGSGAAPRHNDLTPLRGMNP